MPIVYKITYPNGKIYVGKDMTDSIGYFGTPSHAAIAADFTPEQRRKFTVTREVLWESEAATLNEVNAMELHFIRLVRSNDPAIGYNRWPRFASVDEARKRSRRRVGLAEDFPEEWIEALMRAEAPPETPED